MLLAMVAELDQAQDRRGIEAGNLAEIEHHVADRLVPLPVDDPLDPLEQPVRRAEENEAREPEDVDALALLAQQPRLLRRPLDIARKILAREMTPDDADAAIAQREHQAGADHAEHDAHEIAEIDDDERHDTGEAPFHP